MPTNEAIPFFEPGRRLTGHATAAVTGKTFVDVSGDALVDGNYPVAPAAAGAATALGVAAYDVAIGGKVPIIAGQDIIVPVTAEGALAAGDSVVVGAAAGAATAGAGARAVGVAMTAAADGEDAQVRLLAHTAAA